MTDPRWVELSGSEGIFACLVGGVPTGVTSLGDRGRPVDEYLRLITQQIEDRRYQWLPGSVLALTLDGLERSARSDVNLPEPLPAGYLAPPFPWRSASLIRHRELGISPVADQFFPKVQSESGQLELEPGETHQFATKVSPIAVWWRDSERGASAAGGGGVPALPMKQIAGWPTLVVTDRRLVLHGRVEGSGRVDDRRLLQALVPSDDRNIDLAHETRSPLRRAGYYWATQIRHEWIRSIVVRHTATAKRTSLIERLLIGSGGVSDAFGIEVTLPTGPRAEIYFDKGKQGLVKQKNFVDVDALVEIVTEAITRSPAGLTVADQWEEHTRSLINGTETHRHLLVHGARPISFSADATTRNAGPRGAPPSSPPGST